MKVPIITRPVYQPFLTILAGVLFLCTIGVTPWQSHWVCTAHDPLERPPLCIEGYRAEGPAATSEVVADFALGWGISLFLLAHAWPTNP